MDRPIIFTIGGATFDIFVQPIDQTVIETKDKNSCQKWLGLTYGGKVPVSEFEETFGGGAANTAVAFARMGFDVSAVVKVGEEYGHRVIENLAKEGVNTKFVQSTKKDKTALSVIINIFDGDRTVLAYPGANQYLNAKDLPLEALEKADWVFLNHLSGMDPKIPEVLLKFLEKNPRIKLAWNPGREQLQQGVKKWKKLLGRTEILFVNKEEASQFTGTPFMPAGIKQDDPHCHVQRVDDFLPPYANDVSEIMIEFFKYGPRNVVITDGRNGAQCSDGKAIYFCPVASHKRVDTVGAGDAFASGFTSAVILGKDLKTALLYGTYNAYSVVSYHGAQAELLTEKALEKLVKNSKICITNSKLKS